MKLLRAILPLLLLLCLLQAQEKKDDKKKKEKEYAYDHQEVVVTAKKEPITEIANIKEIKKEELEAAGAYDPVQALALVPGVFYTIGLRGEAILQLRGFSQRQVVVMIDGIPVYVPFDGQIDLSQLPVEGLAKIKVIKGNSSTVYGSNSMGGIVNLITQAPSQKTSGSVSLNKGRNLNQRLAFSFGKKLKRLGFWISGEYKHSDGFYLSQKFNPQKNEGGNLRQNSHLKNKAVGGRLHYSWIDGSLFLDFSFVDSRKGVPPHSYESRPRYWRFTQWRKNDVKLSLKHTFLSGLELRGSVFYDSYYNLLDSYDDSTYSTQEENYSFHSTFDDYSLGATFLGDYVRGIHHLRVGVNLKKDVHRAQADYQQAWEKYKASDYSLGLEDEIEVKRNLSFIIGTSFDWLKPLYANGEKLRPSIVHLNPLIGIAYRIDISQVYLSIARKSRFPTLKEFYSEFLGRNIPNPELKEERALNYEFGFRTFLSPRSTFELSFFYSDLKDLIVRKRTGTLFQMQNVDRARYQGAEFSLNYQIQEGYNVNVNYSYLQAINTSPGRKSSKLEYKPPHKFSLFFEYKLPFSLKGMLKVLYIDKRYFEEPEGEFKHLSSYALLDLRIAKTLGKFEVYLLLKNLFDENYEFEAGFPAPGREYIMGISWKY
ncbi:MAG: TonB-dependent receptor plug domain-containing protein [Candidatus Aminicenantaceae bacterium]